MKRCSLFVAILMMAALVILPRAGIGAAGTEAYEYDARGRLIKVTYPGGSTAAFGYDRAGNRTTTGPATSSSPMGTFALNSTSHSARGVMGDIATATIRNTGTATITAISYTCAGGSWHKIGSPPTTLAAGATASYQCRAAASGSSTVVMVWTGSSATNSPFSPGAW